MKREIKFRVWDDSLKVLYTPEMDKEIKNLWDIPKAHGGILTYPDGVLMQFTGLQDKNGVAIYEGDIVELIPKEENIKDTQMYGIKEVVWSNYNACFYYHQFVPMSWPGFDSVEIIGNIYQNKELLK